MEQLKFTVNLGSQLSNEINQKIITQLFDRKMKVSEIVVDLQQSYSAFELQNFIKARKRYDHFTSWYLSLSLLVISCGLVYWIVKGFSGLDLTRIFFSFGLAVVLIVTMLLLVPSSVREIAKDIKQHYKNWQKYYQVIEIFSHRKN